MNYTEFFQFLKNWFETDRVFGDFRIAENGEITTISGDVDMAALLSSDQFVRVIGSKFNDGVTRYPLTRRKAETFSGAVWCMAVPPDVLAIADEIAAYCEKNKDTLNSPFASESFGGYSYSRGSGADSDWRNQFAARLAPWRKL